MKIITTLSIAAMTALFIGCGGGSGGGGTAVSSSATGGSISSDSTITGHLVDAAVEGVFYSCGGPNSRGFTDSEGSFYCESSPIEFYIGKLSLGIVAIPTVDGNVYPQDLVGADRSDFASAEVTKMAQLLQSLDDDTLPSNGIKITQAIMDKFPTGIQFKDKSLNELLSLASVGEIDATSAIEHLQATMGVTTISSSSSSSIESSSSASNSSPASDSSSITVKSPNDVKGYRITSKNGTINQISATYMVEFDCNGNFYYTQDISYQGHGAVIETRGSSINVHDTMWGKRLDWIGTDVDDATETSTNDIYIDASDKITINKSCFVDSECSGGFYVKSIEKIATCN